MKARIPGIPREANVPLLAARRRNVGRLIARAARGTILPSDRRGRRRKRSRTPSPHQESSVFASSYGCLFCNVRILHKLARHFAGCLSCRARRRKTTEHSQHHPSRSVSQVLARRGGSNSHRIRSRMRTHQRVSYFSNARARADTSRSTSARISSSDLPARSLTSTLNCNTNRFH